MTCLDPEVLELPYRLERAVNDLREICAHVTNAKTHDEDLATLKGAYDAIEDVGRLLVRRIVENHFNGIE